MRRWRGSRRRGAWGACSPPPCARRDIRDLRRLHQQLPVPQEVRSCQDSTLGQAPGEVASRGPQGDRATESHVGTSGRWPGRRSGAGPALSQDPRGHGEDGVPGGGEAPRHPSRNPVHTRSPAGPSAQRCRQPQWAAPSSHRHREPSAQRTPAPPHPLGRDTGAQRGSAGCGAQGGGGCFSPRVYWRRGRRPAAPGWRPRCGHFYSHPLKRLKCLRGTKATEKNWKRLTPTPTPGKAVATPLTQRHVVQVHQAPPPEDPREGQGALSTAQLRLWGNAT